MKKGYIYAVIGAILFGTAGIFVKLAYGTGLDSVGLLTVQYIFAVSFMFIMGFITNRKMLKVTKHELLKLAVLGIIGNTFMTVFYYKAFEYLPVALVTMLLYTYPIMVFIYTIIFEKAKINAKKITALIFAFIGCLFTLNIFSGNFEYSIYGVTCGLLSAVFYAFMNIYSEKHLENVNAIAINAYSTLFSLCSLLVYKFPYFIFQNKLPLKSLIYIFMLAAFCEIIPLTLIYDSIKKIGALKVSIISNLEIPTAMLISYIVIKESMSILQIVGSILIIFAIYLIKK